MTDLPDGNYPFIDRRYPLSELRWSEAPLKLEALFKAQADENGIAIVRDAPVELRCANSDYPDATFLILWPSDSDRINMLVPKAFASGQA